MPDYDGPICALCGVKACTAAPETKDPPAFCPMPAEPELLAEVERAYVSDPELRRMALESARTEAAGYCRATRVEEIMDFARRMGWHRLGIAHCVGLMQEAKAARDIFLAGGFEVCTVCCKAGSIDKERVGIRDEEKVRPGQYEAMCSPVGQAALLARGRHAVQRGDRPLRRARQPVLHALPGAGHRSGGQGSRARAQPGRGPLHEPFILPAADGEAGPHGPRTGLRQHKGGTAMTKHDIVTLYEYNRWANGRTLDVVEKLDPAAFLKNLGNSFASVHATLVHIAGAEWAWLRRWHGDSPTALPTGDFPTVASLRERFRIARPGAGSVSGQAVGRAAPAAVRLQGPRRQCDAAAPRAEYAARRQSRDVPPRPGHDDAPAARRDADQHRHEPVLPGSRRREMTGYR